MKNPEINDSTNINVSGKLTVTVNLKGAARRYNQPDVTAEVHLNCGCDVTLFEAKLDEEMAKLRRSILIACGREAVSA